MSSPPLFTVLIPTYRRAGLLPRALESVLAQTWEDFELLVVDDASPDHTVDVVAAVDDPRVRLLRRPTNGGAAASRNTGFAAARGRWVTLLDDDDEYRPGFLARTREVLAEAPPEVALTWCGVRWVRDSPRGVETIREELWQPRFAGREEAYLGFLRNRRIGTNCGLAIRRDAFDAAGGFDESFRGGAEDTDLLIRLVRDHDFRVVPEVLVVLHLHDLPNLRRVSLEKALDYERILAKHAGALADRPRLAADLHYKTGWLACHAGDGRRGRGHLRTALRRHPAHLRALSALALFTLFGRRGARLHRGLSSLRRGRAALSPAAEEMP